MPAVTMKIHGLDELRRKFVQLEQKTQGRVLENAAVSGATLIQNAAVKKCPKLTGNLARSIHTEVAERSNTRVMTEIGTNVEYAPFVEFGTRRMGAQPYMRPAFDNNKQAAINEIKAALKAQIESV